MANASFSVASLDPDTNKENFIKWLESQSQFSGYNFKGSNFNVILDVLARNTMLEAFYVNMGYNESYLDSAQTRDAVISRAKEQNYCPTSMNSSKSTVNINIITNGTTSFTLPFNTRFTGSNSNGTFTFTTNQDYYLSSTSENFSFSNVEIFEGNYVSELYTINNNIENQRFIISNSTVDTSSLKILVSENGGVSMNEYQLATDLYNLSGNSNIFFIQAGKNDTYEIYFGDGVIGHQPISGSIVQIYYRACSGTDADNISKFGLLDNLQTINNCTISSIYITAETSSGGSQAESTESIRFNAPRNIQTQERAATAFDYETLIKKKFPHVADVSAYKGGISPSGVEFGTVLLSCVTASGNPLTQTLKDEIISYCSNLDLIHPSTKMIDASTLYIDVSTNVHVDFSVTNNTVAFYKQNVANSIINFSTNNLQKFKKALRYSKLSDTIDAVDNNAIISNELSLSLKRLIPITINTNTTFGVSFNNPVKNINSDQFIFNGTTTYITDSIANTISNGVIYTVLLNGNNNIISYNPTGSVNYSTGDVTVTDLNITEYLSNNSLFYIYANPVNRDVYSANNDIIKIDTTGIDVNVVKN